VSAQENQAKENRITVVYNDLTVMTSALEMDRVSCGSCQYPNGAVYRRMRLLAAGRCGSCCYYRLRCRWRPP